MLRTCFTGLTNFLLCYLKTYGLHESVIMWIQSLLENRTYRIQVNSSLSSKVGRSSEFQQCSVLAPRLFFLFIKNMPETARGNVLPLPDVMKMAACRKIFADLKLSLPNTCQMNVDWDLCYNVDIVCLITVGSSVDSLISFDCDWSNPKKVKETKYLGMPSTHLSYQQNDVSRAQSR